MKKLVVEMKISPTVIIKAEGDDIKAVHKDLAEAAEVYAQTVCGRCGTTGAVPVHRVSGKFQYYEMKCSNHKCGARLALGQANDGSLYPNRKLGVDGLPTKFDDPKGRYDEEFLGWHFFKKDAKAA